MAFPSFPSFSPQYPNYPTFNIPTIDACISHCKALTDEINALHNRIYQGNLPPNHDLDAEYRKLQDRIHVVARELKPAALALCNQMVHQEALPIRNALEAACGTLKTKHRNLLHQLTELVHENKIQFPLPLEPNCACSKTKTFFIRNSGWIFTGSAFAFGLMTATPVGTYLGPILKEMPQHLGTWCQDMGKIFTQFLSGHTVQNIVASEWLRTLGKASFVAAVVYPTYWYLKEPLAEYRKKAFETLDSALTSAAKYPIRTVLISWAAFYALFRWHGFEGKAFEAVIDPAHTKIFFPLVPALSIPSLVDAMKNFLDGYKNKTPVPALPPAQPPSTAQSQRPNPLPLATQTPPASIQPQQAQAPIDPNLQTPPAQLPLSTLTRPKYLHSRAAQPLSKTPPEPNPPQRKTAKMIDGKIHWIDPTIEDKSGKKKEKVAPIAFTSDDEPSRFILF